MTERFLGEDVIADRDVDACTAELGELLESCPHEVVDAAERVIAVAGTATTLAAIVAWRVRPARRCTAPASRAAGRELAEAPRRARAPASGAAFRAWNRRARP